MKIKIFFSIILSVLILPILSATVLAACAGECIDKDACVAKGGTATPGLCPGAANIQCCTSGSQSGSGGSGSVEIPNPLRTKSIPDLIDRLVNYVIGIATIIFPLVIIYGAFQFLSTGGDMEKVTTARKTIMYAVIGYILILISKGITMIIAEILGGR